MTPRFWCEQKIMELTWVEMRKSVIKQKWRIISAGTF